MGVRKGELGQMSVEAALLLPTMLTLVALLAQPACVLYTRSVMAGAVTDAARAALTAHSGTAEIEAYALRRLSAVPELSIFHEGGQDDWEVEVSGAGDGGSVSVKVTGHVRPLPLLGVLVRALGTADGSLVKLDVEVKEDLRSSWVGGSYEDWVGVWG